MQPSLLDLACEWLASNTWRTAIIAVAVAVILAGSVEVPA